MIFFPESTQFSLREEFKRIKAKTHGRFGETEADEIHSESEISGYLRLLLESVECEPIESCLGYFVIYPNIAPFVFK